MNIKQMKDWINSIPEELNDKEVVYRKISKTENENELLAEDIGISAGSYDPDHEELCLYNSDSYSLFNNLSNQKED